MAYYIYFMCMEFITKMTTIRLPQWGCEVHSFDDYRRIDHMEPIRNYQRKLKQTTAKSWNILLDAEYIFP